jgi:signal transduction histidine kinase
MAVVFPMLSKDHEFLGFLVLGNRRAGTRFAAEDVDLLRNIATQAGLALERIVLQKKLFLKEAEAERLAALNELKSDFVSYVSHELRTPLTSIKLFAELLREPKRGLDRKGKQFIGTIEGETERLNRMVSTILDSAEIEHGVKEFNMRPADLGEIASQAVRTMTYQLKNSGFEVRSVIPRRPVSIIADPDALLQVILNLITNAIKYSADRRYLKISVICRNGESFCTVEDRGIGIPDDMQEKIFERFSRGSARRSGKEGVGLGLALVKHIVEAHNGRVEVQSTPGRGSTFTLVFPHPEN